MPNTDLESENQDSFEIKSGGAFLTPKSRRRLKKGCKDCLEEKMAGEDQSGRRSSLVSLLQRKMSRGSDSVESCGSSASDPGQRHHYRLIILGRESLVLTQI